MSGFRVRDPASALYRAVLRRLRALVESNLHLSEADIEAVRAAANRDGRTRSTFQVCVLDASGQTVAEVEKVIYVRVKDGSA